MNSKCETCGDSSKPLEVSFKSRLALCPDCLVNETLASRGNSPEDIEKIKELMKGANMWAKPRGRN